MTKGGYFAAGCALSHFLTISFLAIIPSGTNTSALFEGRAFYHTSQPSSRQDDRIKERNVVEGIASVQDASQ